MRNLPTPSDPSRSGPPGNRDPDGQLSYPDYGRDAFDGQGEGFEFRRFMAAILRYRWLVLGVTVLGAAGGYAGTLFMSPEYRIQATLWLEAADGQHGQPQQQQGPLRPAELLRAYSWAELLKSYAVLEPAVVEQRLYVEPRSPQGAQALESFAGLKEDYRTGEYRLTVDGRGDRFTLEDGSGQVIQRGAVGDSVGAEVGFLWQPAPSDLPAGGRIEFQVMHPWNAVDKLAAALQTRFDREGSFLRVELTSKDPQRAVSTLNAVVESFSEVAAQLKREKLDELAVILEDQLQYAEANLKQAEIDLESFRVRTITLPSEQPALPIAPGLDLTRNPVFSTYFEMKVEREQIQRDREAIQRALARASQSGLPAEALEVIGSVQRSTEMSEALRRLTDLRAELRALRQRYTDDHPLVQRTVEEIQTLERREIPQLGQRLNTELQVRESQYDERVASASTELQQIPPRVIEEARLRRRVSVAENLYTMLQRRFEEARLAAVSSVPDIRLLDRARMPTRPVRDERNRILLLAIFGSLGLALVGAIVLDRSDSRLRYPTQVKHDLGLPILGAVPHAVLRNGALEAENEAQIAEAFRSVRMNLMYTHDGGGPLVLTVTSPDQGDGKSFVSANLALAFANQGLATVVIDGDTRRGLLHRLFRLQRKPGLTDWLRNGEEGPEAITQPTLHPSLHFVAGGSRTHEGPELLGSPATERLLEQLRERFAVIIVDSPPLRAGVDPFVLGTLTRNVVLVLRNGVTDRELAGAKLELFERLPVRLLGAVLNDVPARGLYGHYAGYTTYIPSYEPYDEGVGAEGRHLPA